MKTCPNPKCKATGIPDDAQFCPKCGEPLVAVSNQWAEKCKTLQKERADLLIQKHMLSQFAEKREKYLSQLNKNESYVKAIQESADIIRHNRGIATDRELKERRRYWLILLGMILLFALAQIVYLWFAFGVIDVIVDIIRFSLLVFILPIWIIKGLLKFGDILFSSPAKHDYTNDYTKTFLSPFIQENEECYVEILNRTDALEDEIYCPDFIQKSISTKIEQIDYQIREIEHQIETIKTL